MEGGEESNSMDIMLEALKLNEVPTEEKLYKTLLFLRQTINVNSSLKNENDNLKEQLSKNDQTKDTLKKLIEALRAQVNLTKEESQLKIQSEAQKRIEITTAFEDQMSEISNLLKSHSNHNMKLKTENEGIATRLSDLVALHERSERDRIERDLRIQLLEAQLSKAKIEKAELNATFTQERLEHQKALLKFREENGLLLQQDALMKEQLLVYQKQYQEVERNMGESGTDLSHFRQQIDKLTKKLRDVECDTAEWKRKFEVSNEQVRKMNTLSLERDSEMKILEKKLTTMENLNRALNQELKKSRN